MSLSFWKRQIPDPIRGLTLDRLARQIDAFQNGSLADFAITADAMEMRDDILKNVITKRKKAVTRHGWEILTEDCSIEAQEHREVLNFFYRNLRCSHALRGDERGGFQTLVYQMMDAVGKGFAVHEIIWKPVLGSACAPACSPRRPRRGVHPAPNFSSLVTAEFRFVPLWYFEATTGRLRFVATPGALQGEPMADRQWLVTVGDALMIACSRAFLFKHYPLQAWLDFSQKFGLPGLRGITSAARGTPEFTDMEAALHTFMSELAVVTNTAESIDLIDLKGSGQPPFSELVERMDRVMASLWRGADLSTMSRDRGYGATLQEQEARVLEQDDAQSISGHLNATIDRWVLEQIFGPAVEPLARIKILVSPKECTPHDLAIDQFLIQHGAKLSLSETLERYGRVQAKPGEPSLGVEQVPSPVPRGAQPRSSLHNSFPKTNSRPSLENSNLSVPAIPQPENIEPATFNSSSSNPDFMNTKLPNSITPVDPAALKPNTPDLKLTASFDDYIQLSPIGIFPHVRGYQNVDRTALENMVKNFNSFFGRLGRRFAGLPFYIGHPDVPGFENLYSDRKAYGWIMDIQVRDDGLYGRTNWSAAGRDLIANGHFKFLSPFWEATRIGSRDGRTLYSPTVLKSVGLTNEPNLPVLPLANDHANSESNNESNSESDCGEVSACLGTSLSLLGANSESPINGGTSSQSPSSSSASLRATGSAAAPYPPCLSGEPVSNSAPQPENLEPSTVNFSSSTPLSVPCGAAVPCPPGLSGEPIPNSAPTPENPEPSTVNSACLEHQLAHCQHEIAQLHARLIQTVLDNAVAQARILPVERPHWQNALTEDFENAAATLVNSTPKLNLQPRTSHLPRVTVPEAGEQKQKRILTLVSDRMRSSGLSYHAAWIETRTDHPELFQS